MWFVDTEVQIYLGFSVSLDNQNNSLRSLRLCENI